jgi:hypothetical protein
MKNLVFYSLLFGLGWGLQIIFLPSQTQVEGSLSVDGGLYRHKNGEILPIVPARAVSTYVRTNFPDGVLVISNDNNNNISNVTLNASSLAGLESYVAAISKGLLSEFSNKSAPQERWEIVRYFSVGKQAEGIFEKNYGLFSPLINSLIVCLFAWFIRNLWNSLNI